MRPYRIRGLDVHSCHRCLGAWIDPTQSTAQFLSADRDPVIDGDESELRRRLDAIGRRLSDSVAELQAFFDNAPVEMVVKDVDGRYLQVNKRTEDLYGRSSDDVRGRLPMDLFPTDSARLIQEADKAVANSGKPHVIEVTDGIGGVFQATLFPIHDDARAIVGLGGVAIDISALRAAERALNELNEELERRVQRRTSELRSAQKELLMQEREAAIGRVAATVSHELLNPLAAVRTSLYIIAELVDEPDDRLRRTIARTDRNIVRCDRIINELAEFVQQREPVPSNISLDAIVTAALDEWSAPDAVNVQTSLQAIDAEICVDVAQVRDALAKILDNAADAVTDKGAQLASDEPAIVVTTRVTPEGVCVQVADRGIGMSADVLNKMFEPLFSTKGFGVGLGATVVKNIVESNGGRIEVDSTDGGGSTVSVCFPPR